MGRRLDAGAVCLLAVSLLGGSAPVEATLLRVANLQDLVQESERIFVGECIAERTAGTGGIPYTEYTFTVSESIKGITEATVTLRQFGLAEPVALDSGRVRLTRVPGMPRYRPGQNLLLFVGPESPIGLSSPVGLEQGAFRVMGEPGVRRVVNGFDNRNLMRGLSADSLRTLGVRADDARRLAGFRGGALDYDSFVGLVRRLAAPRREGR